MKKNIVLTSILTILFVSSLDYSLAGASASGLEIPPKITSLGKYRAFVISNEVHGITTEQFIRFLSSHCNGTVLAASVTPGLNLFSKFFGHMEEKIYGNFHLALFDISPKAEKLYEIFKSLALRTADRNLFFTRFLETINDIGEEELGVNPEELRFLNEGNYDFFSRDPLGYSAIQELFRIGNISFTRIDFLDLSDVNNLILNLRLAHYPPLRMLYTSNIGEYAEYKDMNINSMRLIKYDKLQIDSYRKNIWEILKTLAVNELMLLYSKSSIKRDPGQLGVGLKRWILMLDPESSSTVRKTISSIFPYSKYTGEIYTY